MLQVKHFWLYFFFWSVENATKRCQGAIVIKGKKAINGCMERLHLEAENSNANLVLFSQLMSFLHCVSAGKSCQPGVQD